MRRRALLTAGLAALPDIGVHAQSPAYDAADLRHAQALRDRALHDREAWRLVESLTTEVGARPAGSAGDVRAKEWALAQFQRLNLAHARAEPIALRVWQRGAASARLVAPVAQPLVMAALGNSVATPDGGIEAELAVYPTLDALKADTSTRAQGRIVYIDQATERTRDGSGYGAAVGMRISGAIEAARRGALALAIRSVGTSNNRIAHTGLLRYELHVPRIPAFAVSVPDADLIARLHVRGVVPTMQVLLDAKSDVDAITHNLIAEVPGTDLAQEIVLIGAHLDSWDVGQGALDDGAGVAIVTAAAALIRQAGRVPRRTIRVVLFGNEENGFDGARVYGDRYRDAPHQLVGESDFGAGRIYRLRGRFAPPAQALLAPMAQLLEPLGVALPDQGVHLGTPGPDAAVLMRRHRWPAIDLAQDGTHYFDVHHTENRHAGQGRPRGAGAQRRLLGGGGLARRAGPAALRPAAGLTSGGSNASARPAGRPVAQLPITPPSRLRMATVAERGRPPGR